MSELPKGACTRHVDVLAELEHRVQVITGWPDKKVRWFLSEGPGRWLIGGALRAKREGRCPICVAAMVDEDLI